MPFCTRCGREHTGDARFCAGCGTPLAPVARREERKVVTVLFADIVGSTAHAEGLDPEDVRAFLARYHERTRHELERYVEEIGSTDLVRSHVNLGGINFQLGNLDVAHHHHHRVALDLCERRGFRPYARWLVIELAQDAFAAGDWAEARRLVSSRLEAADGGASYMDVQARFLALELAVATTGVVDDDVLDSLVADAYRVADPQVVLPVLAGAARLLSRTGATERAGPLLDAFLEHAAGGNLCAWEAYVAIAAGERGRAAQLLALAERGVRSRSHASRLAAAGDHVAAADVLASMGALSEEAGARLHAATLLAGSGRAPRGAVQAERAAAFYDEVGATWLADRARALGAAADAGLAAVSRRSDGR